VIQLQQIVLIEYRYMVHECDAVSYLGFRIFQAALSSSLSTIHIL